MIVIIFPEFWGAESNNSRNGLMPDVREWLMQQTLTAEQLKQVSGDFSLYGSSHLNLMTSSKNLLTALTGEAVANELVNLRANGDLTTAQMTQYSGLSNTMEIFLSPSHTLQLLLTSRYHQAQVKQRLIIKFNPYANKFQLPYNIMQTSGG